MKENFCGRVVRGAEFVVAGKGVAASAAEVAARLAAEGSCVLFVTGGDRGADEVGRVLGRRFRLNAVTIGPHAASPHNTPAAPKTAFSPQTPNHISKTSENNDNFPPFTPAENSFLFPAQTPADGKADAIPSPEKSPDPGGKGTLSEAESIRAGEDARLVAAAGGEDVLFAAAYAATRAGLPFFAIPTGTFSRLLCSPVALLSARDGHSELFEVNPPAAVLVDYTLVGRTEAERANILGEAASVLASVFDLGAVEAMGGEPVLDGTDLKRAAISAVAAETDEQRTEALLAVAVLAARERTALFGGEQRLTEAALAAARRSGKPVRGRGETAAAMAACYMRAAVAFLALPFASAAVPDNNLMLDALTQRLGYDPFAAAARLKPTAGQAALAPVLFALKESRTALLGEAIACERALTFSLGRLKRLYKDKGFSYNKYLSGTDVATAFALAGEMCGPPSLVDVMRASGRIGPA